MYTDKINVISEDGNVQTISKNENKKMNYMDINLQNSIVTVEEQSSGLFTADSLITITNTDTSTATNYTINAVAKEIYTSGNIIGLNLGTELEFINTSGWLVKRYLGNEEITKITLSNSIAGIVFRDRVEIINL